MKPAPFPKPGKLPPNFRTLMPDIACELYGDPHVALLMEVRCEGFWQCLLSTHARYPLATVIGTPDLKAAREMTNLSKRDVYRVLGWTSEIYDDVENGLQPILVADAVKLCDWFDWPLAALYRDECHLHADATVIGKA